MYNLQNSEISLSTLLISKYILLHLLLLQLLSSDSFTKFLMSSVLKYTQLNYIILGIGKKKLSYTLHINNKAYYRLQVHDSNDIAIMCKSLV